WDLVDLAREYGRDRDPLIRQQLAWAYAKMQILQLNQHSAASVTDLLWGEYRRGLGVIATDIMGADALVRPDGEAYATSYWQHVLLSGPAESVANGTGDLQRTSIGEHLLGLPK
ncbi:MAG TPA: acyl-CoA dehydrogenase, partial [Chloroflexota bacterium]|nr:acyl-CoA dehydrogenase [Chloroflexota bacterium]